MSKSQPVFRNQLEHFKRERGMLVFYCLSIVVIGIVVPIFTHTVSSSLTTAALLTAMFLKPILADSIAGEREHRTLETLLSTPINGRSVMGGKFQFCFFFAISFFGVAALCAALTNLIMGYEMTLNAWQWVSIIVLAIFNYGAISIAGVYVSAISGDMQIANSRVSMITYPLGLLFLVYLTLIVTVDFIPAIIIGFVLIIIYLCAIIIFTIKTYKMKQSDYFVNIKITKYIKTNNNYTSYIAPKSQFGVVFGFELKYLLTLKLLLLNFGIMCIGPAAVACLLPTLTGELDLNYAVFITVLVIPRIPTNLIAYSIGGEKVYKTGESLLSTPLHIRPIFIAKCMVPIFISAAMLSLSSLITLIGANIAVTVMPDIAPVHGYTAGQLVLLFPVGIMSSMLMMFISAILSMLLKTPRHSLYVTSIIAFLFVAPVLAIVYLGLNMLVWSVIYCIVLLICNVVCIMSISDKISRPSIMKRL